MKLTFVADTGPETRFVGDQNCLINNLGTYPLHEFRSFSIHNENVFPFNNNQPNHLLITNKIILIVKNL